MPPCRQLLLPAQPLATAGLCSVPKVLPINGLMQCVLSAVWLPSPMHLRSVHVAARANNPSFLPAEWYPFAQVFHSLFKLEIVMNRVTKNTCVQALGRLKFSLALGKHLGVGLLGCTFVLSETIKQYVCVHLQILYSIPLTHIILFFIPYSLYV